MISTSIKNNNVFQPKPMAISSITSPPLPNASLVISTSKASHHPSLSPYPSAVPSPPESPTYRNHHNYLQQHRHSHLYFSNSHYTTNHQRYQLQRTSSMSSLQVPPLSLQERRQRNKAASAKYRAKKNQQHGEMRSLISSLSKENDLLQRQLDHVRRENHRLKATCDRIRGKMLAEKMLKKLLNGKEEQDDQPDDEEEEFHADAVVSSDNEQQRQILERFDEDINFDDEDEDDDDQWNHQQQQEYNHHHAQQ